MNRFIIAAMALLLVPTAAAEEATAETGPLDDIISPPGEACEVTAEWVGHEDTVEVGVVWDSHNCGGIGYRFGENVDCNPSVPCSGWIWLYGGATASAALAVGLVDEAGPRACEGATEWTPLAAGMELGSVNDSHDCVGFGYRDASGNWRCDVGVGYGNVYTNGPCYGWVWIV